MPHPTRNPRPRKACVIGAGPNGLAAAIVLAPGRPRRRTLRSRVHCRRRNSQHGSDPPRLSPRLRFRSPSLGRRLSVFHFPSSSRLRPRLDSLPAPLAHPLDGGAAVILERDLYIAEPALGVDGAAWRSLMQPYATRWPDLAADILRPASPFPRHPFLLARFGLTALLPATIVAHRHFRARTHPRSLRRPRRTLLPAS